MRANFRIFLIVLLSAVALFALPACAQQLSKRLIMKDGSYQLATKWEVHGDRVRYYSAERDDWEEVPNSFVDWDATNKYEQDRASGDTARSFQLHKELTEERQADETKSPTVAPGLRLEDPHAAYLLETFQNKVQLVQLQQISGALERDVKKSVFHGQITGANAKILLTGAHASTQSHTTVPSLYVNSQEESDEDANQNSSQSKPGLSWDRFRIVNLEIRQDKRAVGNVEVSRKEKINTQQTIVKTNDEQLTGGWIKLTPVDPLPPGEYALVELLGDEGINLYVWDFGMNPQAPANANAEQALPTIPVSTQAPELQKR